MLYTCESNNERFSRYAATEQTTRFMFLTCQVSLLPLYVKMSLLW